MKVALYLRVSTDKQTTENQKIVLENYAQANSWEIVKTYCDEGISGSNNNRPEYLKMLEDAKNEKFKCIVVFQLTRLGRSIPEIINSVYSLKSDNIGVCSIKENLNTLDNSYATKILLTIFALLSEIELDLNRERTQAGLDRAKAEGKKLGPKFDNTIDNAAIELLHKEGFSIRKIAKELKTDPSKIQRRLKYISQYNSVERKEVLRMMHDENKSLTEVSEKLKIPTHIIYDVLEKKAA